MSSVAANSQNGQTDTSFCLDLQAQVAAKVQQLHSGHANVAGEWLVTFQKSECAWQVCVDILLRGPLPDLLPLQFFCSQTLARVARAFIARLPQNLWLTHRTELLRLLNAHSSGSAVIWRQLALAITCADLWLGSWSANGPLSATELPVAIRRELLVLPPDLLFCERALPLDDAALWQNSLNALHESCTSVFSFFLNQVEVESAGTVLAGVATWLRALRKGVEWTPNHDPAVPLRALAGLKERLIAISSASPMQAVDVAHELALWGSDCDNAVLECLVPLLHQLFSSLVRCSPASLMPLLSSLSIDRWARAAHGELALDWSIIANAALDVMVATTSSALEDRFAGSEAEDAFGIWQLLALTMQKGTWAWKPSLAQSQSSSAVCQCFEQFCHRAVFALTLRGEPSSDNVEALFRIREAAESAVSAWAAIFGGTQAWEEAIWQPLRCVRSAFSAKASNSPGLELCQATEVAMWWAATLSCSAHEKSQPFSGSVVLEFAFMDNAPMPWRALLWASACSLASCAKGDLCLQLLTWMLKRPPSASLDTVPWLFRHIDLSYAQQVETLCSQILAGGHLEHAERLAQLALEPIPKSGFHTNSAKARGHLLAGCRQVLGGDAARVCACLSQAVLAPLRQAVEAEARAGGSNDQWPAVQVLSAALVVALPDVPKAANGSSCVDCPPSIAQLWEANWDMLQASLLTWTPSPETNQPVVAASDALAAAAARLRPLLQPTLVLLGQSIGQSAQPHVQINAVHRIVTELSPASNELQELVALLGDAIIGISDATLSRSGGLKQSPATLEALFQLLAASILLPSSNVQSLRLNQGHLRSRLLGQDGLVKRCLEVVADALPDCPTPGGVEWTLVFVARLLKGLKEGRELDPNLKQTLWQALPQLCFALTHALASQVQLTKIEYIHYVAEVLLQVAQVFPDHVEGALNDGLGRLAGLGVPDYSRHRLARHVHHRSEWASTGAWIDGLQQIAFDWQNERRQSIT